MKNRLLKEIAKTIRALEKLAIDWEKQFPANEGKGPRMKAGKPRRWMACVDPKAAAATDGSQWDQ
jgi:hypothetical protein